MASRSTLSIAVLTFLAALSLSGCGDHANPEEPEAPDAGARRTMLMTRLAALFDRIEEIRQIPWLAETELVDQLTQEGARATALYQRLDRLETEIPSPEQPRVLASIENAFESLRRRYVDFETVFREDARTAHDAFSVVSAVSSKITHLIEKGIPMPAESARIREIVQEHETGRRYWISQMTRLLRGEKVDETIRGLGLTTLQHARDAAAPLLPRLKKAEVRLVQLDNHENGIAARLAWADRVVGGLPADHPFRNQPEADLSEWRRRFEALRTRAKELRARVLDESRDADREFRDLGRAFADLMHALNTTFLPQAAAAGVGPPR